MEYPLGQGEWERKAIFHMGYAEGEIEAMCDSMYFTGLGDITFLESDMEDARRSLLRYERGWSDCIDCAPFPGRSRKGAVAFTLFGRIYVGLGVALDRKPFEIGLQYLSDFWWYDPWEDTWDSVPAPFPAGEGRERWRSWRGRRRMWGRDTCLSILPRISTAGIFMSFRPRRDGEGWNRWT